MAITKVEVDLKLKVTETKALAMDGVTDPSIVVETATSAKDDYSPTTTVPMTTVWADVRTFTTAETLDLTALPQANFTANINFTGLKLQAIKIIAAAANAGGITFVHGLTNGYHLWGAATGSVTVLPGCSVMMVCNDNLDDVATADATIDVSGTGTLAYDIELVAG